MAGEPITIPLSELSIRITKGTTPTTLGYPFVDRGINFVKSEALSAGGSIDPATFSFIDEETHAKLSRSQLKEGDVLFSMAGVYLGKTAVVDGSILPANTNQAVGIIRLDLEKAEPRFIHYALSSPDCRAWVLRSAAQSAQPNFNLQDIGSLPIPAYKLTEQRAIAHILGTMDDKIELNRRRNQTLEAMARALFKDWFVDFGPVRAKMEGREPYLPAYLWQRFPERLDDEGKPEGWDGGTLADYSSLNPESWSKSSAPDEIEYVDLANTKRGTIETTVRLPWAEAPSRAQRILRAGDTIVGTVRPRNGSYAMVGTDGLTGSTGFAVLRPNKHIFRDFVFLAATTADNIERMSHLADGAAYPAIRPDVVLASPALRPDSTSLDGILKGFSDLVSNWVDLIEHNKRQSQNLAALRDTLLPKLISGELRIADAEKFIEARV